MTKVVFLICIVVTCISSQAAQATQSEAACCCFSTCPSGWTRFQSRCYKFNGTVDTQPNAEAACNEEVFYDQVGNKLAGEGHLASINSQEEQNFVYNLWQHSLIRPHALIPGSVSVNTQNAQWIGAVKNSQNQWTWTDGSYWGFTRWDTGINSGYSPQPTGDGSCVHMWTKSYLDAPGNWNDYHCEGANRAKLPHTCEIGLIRHCE